MRPKYTRVDEKRKFCDADRGWDESAGERVSSVVSANRVAHKLRAWAAGRRVPPAKSGVGDAAVVFARRHAGGDKREA